MRNKAPLPLMEQLIMILVFALTAALCLQGFALADRISNRQAARSQAVIRVQNAAEVLQSVAGDYTLAADMLGGSWNGSVWSIGYDTDWQEISDHATYILQVIPAETHNPFLGTAQVRVQSSDDILFEITAAWQEVVPHEN